MTKPEIVKKFTVNLDSDFLVMDVVQWTDCCRVEVVYQLAPTARTTVMVQTRATMELAIAAIARDFSTFATRALASLPTIGELADEYGEEEEEEEEKPKQ